MQYSKHGLHISTLTCRESCPWDAINLVMQTNQPRGGLSIFPQCSCHTRLAEVHVISQMPRLEAQEAGESGSR